MNSNWNRSEVIALAKESCTQCWGFGLRKSSADESGIPCNCVFRSIFRACYRRFKYCGSREKQISSARLEQVNGLERRQIWGLKDEEYIADFCLTAKRALDEFEYRIFKYHYLLGADWKLCCRQLQIERGDFFHAVYRIQEKLGRTFRELEPYALYPLDEYFGGTVRASLPGTNRSVLKMPVSPQRHRLDPPLRKVA